MISKRSIHYVWRPPGSRNAPQAIAPGIRQPFNKTLGIATEVRRIPILGHFEGAGRAPVKSERFDSITETWSGNHLFRASVTLAKV